MRRQRRHTLCADWTAMQRLVHLLMQGMSTCKRWVMPQRTPLAYLLILDTGFQDELSC